MACVSDASGGNAKKQLTCEECHSIGRMLFIDMVLHGIEAGELFGTVRACMSHFEVLLNNVPHQAFFLHLSEAMDPTTYKICTVWTHGAVTEAQMLRQVGESDKRATNGLACHPTTHVIAVLGVACERYILQEPLYILRSCS